MTGKGMVTDTKKDVSFWVRNYDTPPDEAPPIKMEVRWRGAVADGCPSTRGWGRGAELCYMGVALRWQHLPSSKWLKENRRLLWLHHAPSCC